MSKKSKPKSEVHKYQAEMQKLLETLVHSLYTEREIFVRELVSNASDALSKVQIITLTEKEVLDKDVELQVQISYDEKKRQIYYMGTILLRSYFWSFFCIIIIFIMIKSS